MIGIFNFSKNISSTGVCNTYSYFFYGNIKDEPVEVTPKKNNSYTFYFAKKV